jgi:DNA-binding HxlR family transcriptional regulator
MESVDMPPGEMDARVAALVADLIGIVADKWTMQILEILSERGELRFGKLSKCIPTISQKMLTQTLREMERNGLVVRTVHAVIPPHVDYRLTDSGSSLSEAFCGVWMWAAEHLEHVENARRGFAASK